MVVWWNHHKNLSIHIFNIACFISLPSSSSPSSSSFFSLRFSFLINLERNTNDSKYWMPVTSYGCLLLWLCVWWSICLSPIMPKCISSNISPNLLFSFQKYITNPPFYYTCLHFLLLKLVRKCKRCYTIYCMEEKKK